MVEMILVMKEKAKKEIGYNKHWIESIKSSRAERYSVSCLFSETGKYFHSKRNI